VGVVMLHETMHEISRKKMSCVILKLNFEKAYGKVSSCNKLYELNASHKNGIIGKLAC
jgi:hypothetical protein